jgi:hypothetical protein
MSVKTMDEKKVEKILVQIADQIRQMADDPTNAARNGVIQEVAAVIEHMSAGALRYQLLSVPQRDVHV